MAEVVPLDFLLYGAEQFGLEHRLSWMERKREEIRARTKPVAREEKGAAVLRPDKDGADDANNSPTGSGSSEAAATSWPYAGPPKRRPRH